MGLFNTALVSLFNVANHTTTKEAAASAWESALATPNAWIAVYGGVGFQNSWVNAGGNLGVARYRKGQDGRIYVSAMVKNGTLNTTAFALPAGYCPTSQLGFHAVAFNGGTMGVANVVIFANGNVNIYAAAGYNSEVDISISFATDE